MASLRVLYLCVLSIAASGLLAQEPSKPMTERARKLQQARSNKELQSAYSKWLTVDVGYIVTDAERAAFLKLNNDEEREQFVEQFWLRRDPTPDTEENEFKEEHYRRFAYANEHFSSGIPGWKSDRGHVYIIHGAPDERAEHSSGGFYSRPPEEGGGTTSTFPFEEWRYRHLDGVGDNVTIEFVDTTMSGEYRLTIDPSEKDALLYVPGAGLTDAEAMGLSTKSARFNRTDGTHLGASLYGESESMNPFTRMEQAVNLLKAPAIKGPDSAFIGTSIRYDVLPIRVRTDYFPVTAASVFAYITLQFENRDLQFTSKDGWQRATVHIAGQITTMTHRHIASFEDTVSVGAPDAMLETFARQKSVYSRSLALAPGSYRLNILAKDMSGGSVSAYEQRLIVPAAGEARIAASSIVLADAVETLPVKSIGAGQFAVGDTKVRPRMDNVFHAGERMRIFFKVYNFDADAGAAAPREIVFDVTRAGESVAHQITETSAAADVTVNKSLDLTAFAPGAYVLRVTVADKATGQTLVRSTPFTVSPPL